MNDREMYTQLSLRVQTSIHSSLIPNELGVSILHDFIDNINSGMYPKYAYNRANSKIDNLLEYFAEVA